MEWIRDDRNLCHERVNKLVFINQFQTKEIKGVIRQQVRDLRQIVFLIIANLSELINFIN